MNPISEMFEKLKGMPIAKGESFEANKIAGAKPYVKLCGGHCEEMAARIGLPIQPCNASKVSERG